VCVVCHSIICNMVNHFCLQNCLYRSSKFQFYDSGLLGCYTVLTGKVLHNASKDNNAFLIGSKMECNASCRRIDVIFVLKLLLCVFLTVTMKMT
jgi:hypothetical protein